MKNIVLIVDPFSSGTIYAEKLSALGYHCVAILSSMHIQDSVKNTFISDFFINKYFLTADQAIENFHKNEVAAVIIGSESGVFVGEQLADRYAVPRNPTLTSSLRRDKFEMQKIIRAKALKNIYSQKITQQQHRIDDFPDFNSYVLKPTQSASTQDVAFFSNKNDLIEAIEKIQWGKVNATGELNNEFIIQEFISGTEYVVDLVAFSKGNYVVAALSQYKKGRHNDSAFVYERLDVLDMNDHAYEHLIHYAQQCAEILDFACGPIHMEIMQTETGPVLIEVGARLHGGIAPFIFERCYAPSLVDLSIASYLARDIPLDTIEKTHDASIIFGINYNPMGNLFDVNAFKEKIYQLSTYAYLRVFTAQNIPPTKDLLDCPFIVGLIGPQEHILLDEQELRNLTANFLD